MNYKALYATEVNGKLEIGITNKQLDDKLSLDEVLIKVQYSSLNYKDAMALNGNMAKIMRRLPMSPGIDLSGTVEMSSSKNFNVGDEVLVTGFGMGEKFSGGYSQYVKIDSNYIVKKPNNISLRESMIIGTAGFTAMLAVDEILESNFDKSKAKILISGSTGGVASISLGFFLMSKLKFDIPY
jgi:acrylyl-CoA reductase (NADPH)